jgi:hypothetical protein
MTRSRDIADSQDNLGGPVPPVTAGKNIVINGAFDVWQRGTTFTNPGANTYGPDRWTIGDNTGCVFTRQSTDAPTGFQYFARAFRTAGTSNSSNINFVQSIDTPTSIPFAGKTVTLSLYLRKGANGPSNINIALVWGTATDGSLWSGGGSGGGTIAGASQAITTSWTRYTYTGTVPSNATQLFVWAYYAASGTSPANEYFDITGVQLEQGSVATPFSRAGGTIQGELAACQRYYWRQSGKSDNYSVVGNGFGGDSTTFKMQVKNPVAMRTAATSLESSGVYGWDNVNLLAMSSLTLQFGNETYSNFTATGSVTQFRPYALLLSYPNQYIGFSAEI